jgi:hypothetical protein
MPNLTEIGFEIESESAGKWLEKASLEIQSQKSNFSKNSRYVLSPFNQFISPTFCHPSQISWSCVRVCLKWCWIVDGINNY